MSAYILNLEQVKKQVDTSKSFLSLIWLKWAVLGHFLLIVSKKRGVCLLYHHHAQANFEYSPLGNIFYKGLKEKDKKKGLLKRLKNIEKKSKQ